MGRRSNAILCVDCIAPSSRPSLLHIHSDLTFLKIDRKKSEESIKLIRKVALIRRPCLEGIQFRLAARGYLWFDIGDGCKRTMLLGDFQVMVTSEDILNHMEKVVVGKRSALQMVLAAMLAGGHVLIQDVPGVAKTLLARTLAKTFEMDFTRVQMTPDLLPADLTGTGVWDESTRSFGFQPGPIFTQVLLADELNRATPRTQAGLLEAMEERLVTVDGIPHRLPRPFFVIATQNPVEQQGVFPLPEAQLDRFLIQIHLGYPTHEEEVGVVAAQSVTHPLERLEPIATHQDFESMCRASREVYTDPTVTDYLVRLVATTRGREELVLGASPRASLAIHHTARALAYILGDRFIRPDHVQAVARPVLRHRLILTPQSRLAGVQADEIVESVLDRVDVPIYTGS